MEGASNPVPRPDRHRYRIGRGCGAIIHRVGRLRRRSRSAGLCLIGIGGQRAIRVIPPPNMLHPLMAAAPTKAMPGAATAVCTSCVSFKPSLLLERLQHAPAAVSARWRSENQWMDSKSVKTVSYRTSHRLTGPPYGPLTPTQSAPSAPQDSPHPNPAHPHPSPWPSPESWAPCKRLIPYERLKPRQPDHPPPDMLVPIHRLPKSFLESFRCSTLTRVSPTVPERPCETGHISPRENRIQPQTGEPYPDTRPCAWAHPRAR